MIFGVPLPDGTTKWRALTFDDTPWFTGQTWGYGNYLMFDAAEHLTGYVFDTPTTQAATPPTQPPEKTSNISGNAATATALKTARTIGGVSFDGTANIVPSTVAVADTTSATCYLALVEAATGNLSMKTDAGLTYNASTAALTLAGTLNGITVSSGTGTLSLSSYNLSLSGNLTTSAGLTTTGTSSVTLAFPSSGTPTYTLPGTTATIARTDAAQTFTGKQTFSEVNVSFFSGGITFGTGTVAGTGSSITSANGGNLNVYSGGGIAGAFGLNSFGLTSGGHLGWTGNASDPTAARTAIISQSSAGVLQIGTTANNASGSLLLTNLTASGALITTPQTLSGAGAVNLTTTSTHITTTGAAQPLTLANGTVGQIKIIAHSVDGGDFILTPTTALGFTTYSSTTAGDMAILEYTAAGWTIIARGGTIA